VFRLDAASTSSPILTVTQQGIFGADIYVRGINEDWNANDTTRMAPGALDPTTYRAVLTAPAGPDNAGFKIASFDWSTVNCGSASSVTIGQPLAIACPSQDNIGITFPTAGQYLFKLDATNTAAPVVTVEKAPFDVDIFIRGVGTDWSASIHNRLQYQGSGIYRAYKTAAAAGPDPDGFKIASGDWTTVDCGSATPVTLGTPLTLTCPGNNIGIDFPAVGAYLFTLDATNPAAPSLTVTGP
jgi:hypothetical protein